MLAPPSARQRARTNAAPCLTSMPPRGEAESTGAAALGPGHWFLSPPIHLMRGFRGSLPLLKAHACAWWSWRGLASTLGAGRPLTPASRNGLWFDGSFTAGLCAAIGTPWKASHGRRGLAGGRSSGAAPLACGWPLRFFLLEGDARYAALAPASRPALRAPQLRWVPALTPAPFAWASPRQQVVSLQPAGKYQRPAWRPSQGHKGIDERALMASPQPSPPW